MIKKSLFIKSINNYKFIPLPRLPEFFLIGRSNVGKSTFVNILTNRNKISFVSKKPGKTINLNYFLLNDSFYLVDLPGYGFSKQSQKNKNNIFYIINYFLKNNSFVQMIFQLMDFKVGPTKLDLQIYLELIKSNLPITIIFNKKDKISRNKILLQIKNINQKFLFSNLSFIPKYFLLSCQNKEGLRNIFEIINLKLKYELIY
ncbi:ribosome biogenesis GTP-binding protein YsxC [Candidatus Phytoplasma oryzae]|uniref:Probable GTP-binding protein EngB n=1 Tax=Candidatus Phytoplasma oryzae TaxID=203274 RepID=A0A139JQC4_9MOLU|nr:ribosome biogenesis GTP-binding protein YihA/YsxC [Candidatus Phytoplasma oryzae]KXT29177.1 ribosome biogenesis GTP-binding protein YsxC [Candidatus Phytoplasma oryzae]RAM58051.1 ribosome biogenesis GTP-binding protein [Candidatus Phytoplasma oryzae]